MTRAQTILEGYSSSHPKNYDELLRQVSSLLYANPHDLRAVQLLYTYFSQTGSHTMESTMQDLGQYLMKYGYSFIIAEQILNLVMRKLSHIGQTRMGQLAYNEERDEGKESSLLENALLYSKLKKRKIPLTPQEHSRVMRGKAHWDDGTPGVWKVKLKNGKVVYGSNTHRAMAVHYNLDAAIKKFHAIKRTS